jgi:hypothetical protein
MQGVRDDDASHAGMWIDQIESVAAMIAITAGRRERVGAGGMGAMRWRTTYF